MHCILLPASLFVLLLWPAVAGALTNGSFEPDLAALGAGPARAAAIPGWRASGEPLWRSGEADGFAAPNGGWAVAFPSGRSGASVLRQVIATVPGRAYELWFWLGSRADASGPGAASVLVQAGAVREVITIANADPELLWQPHVVRFTAASASTTIAFESRRSRAAAWLDGVVVRDAPAARLTASR